MTQQFHFSLYTIMTQCSQSFCSQDTFMLSFWNTNMYNNRRELNSPMCSAFSVLKYAGLVEEYKENPASKHLGVLSGLSGFQQSACCAWGWFSLYSSCLGFVELLKIVSFFLVFVFPPIMWKVWPLTLYSVFGPIFSVLFNSDYMCISTFDSVGYWCRLLRPW